MSYKDIGPMTCRWKYSLNCILCVMRSNKTCVHTEMWNPFIKYLPHAVPPPLALNVVTVFTVLSFSCFFSDPQVQSTVKWPIGTYALPMVDSVLSCPGTPFYWKIGYRIQDTEDILPSNDWPKDCHLKGPYTWSMVQLNFCSKTNYYEDEMEYEFPSGEYCVYKKGASCPPGE